MMLQAHEDEELVNLADQKKCMFLIETQWLMRGWDSVLVIGAGLGIPLRMVVPEPASVPASCAG